METTLTNFLIGFLIGGATVTIGLGIIAYKMWKNFFGSNN